MNKENCALKLVDEIILYYDARSKKHQITSFCSYMKPCACGYVISETSNSNTYNNKQVSATICFTLNPSMLASVQCTNL